MQAKELVHRDCSVHNASVTTAGGGKASILSPERHAKTESLIRPSIAHCRKSLRRVGNTTIRQSWRAGLPGRARRVQMRLAWGYSCSASYLADLTSPPSKLRTPIKQPSSRCDKRRIDVGSSSTSGLEQSSLAAGPRLPPVLTMRGSRILACC